MTQQDQQSEHFEDSVKDRVFAALDESNVQPRSKYYFLCLNWLVWGLWALSVLFGGLAVAVVTFVSTHRYYDIYEATHENFYTFILEALPYVWFVVFGGMLLLAVWQLRNTRRGYRQSVSVLAGSSFVFSLVLGGLFHVGGFGWTLDNWLGQVAPMYASQAAMERKMWQNPNEGRLIGRQVRVASTSPIRIQFTDIDGAQWQIVSTDLSEQDLGFLSKGLQVRLLGQRTSSSSKSFHGCGVFPWMFDQPTKMAQISEERQIFVDRMYKHHEDAEARRIAIEREVSSAQEVIASTSPCHGLAAVRRVHEQLHP